MKVLSRCRGGGKTFQSIVESGRSQAVIVCATEIEANRVMREAEIMGVKISKPLSCAFARERLMGHHSGIIIDNLDWVLQSFLGSSVHAVTIDGPPAEINWSEAATDKQQPHECNTEHIKE